MTRAGWRKERNSPIGIVSCPVSDCARDAAVHRFATRGRANQFAGKLYAVCPDHGRLFADGRESGQEWLLNRATIYGPDGPPAAQEPAAAAPAPKPAPVPAPALRPAAEPARPRSGLLID